MIEAYYAGRGNLKGIFKVGRHDGEVGEGEVSNALYLYKLFSIARFN